MKTPRQQIIKKYARAFLQAYQTQLQPADLEPLSEFAYFLKHHQTLSFLMHHNIIDVQEQVSLYIKALVHSAAGARAGLVDAIKQLVTILAQHERLSFLPGIMSLIVLRFFNVIGYQHATILTAIPVTHAQQEEITQSFKALTGKNVDAEFHVDPGLIAGMKIISQDYVWDSSIAGKIKALRVH